LKFVEKLKYLDALIILLNHNNKDIVFYSLGILTNALSDEEIKYYIMNIRENWKFLSKQYSSEITKPIFQILEDCCMDDYEIITLALRVL